VGWLTLGGLGPFFLLLPQNKEINKINVKKNIYIENIEYYNSNIKEIRKKAKHWNI
jgi:hypothetical protein